MLNTRISHTAVVIFLQHVCPTHLLVEVRVVERLIVYVLFIPHKMTFRMHGNSSKLWTSIYYHMKIRIKSGLRQFG